MENHGLPQKALQEDKFLNALADNFRLQEAIINSTQLAIISTTPDGIISSFNKAAEQMLRYSANELIERSTPIIFHDVDEVIQKSELLSIELGINQEPVFEVFTSKLQTESPFRAEWKMVRKDGSHFPGLVTFSALQDEQEELIGYVVIVEDISDKREAARQAAASEEKFKMLAENIPGVIYLCQHDEHYSMIYLNDHIETLTGYKASDFIKGKVTYASIILPEDRNAGRTLVEESLKNRTSFKIEYRIRDNTGNIKVVEEVGVGVYLHDQLQYIEGFILDITERKRSEDNLILSKRNLEAIASKLQEQNRQLDEFAHIISHNLRSPIGNIHALINLLHSDSAITDYKLIFEKLKNVSKNLSETMNDLMDTIKVRENVSIERNELKFKEILDKVVQSLEGDLIRAGASVTFDFNEATTLYYPKAYLESIFQNLLSNSLKYRSEKRKPVIHFQTRMTGHSIELRASDNGLGIDMERFGDKLFGLHKTFHEHEEARGVGLFLIKTQIEAMGGSITAESSVDSGTTFIIQF